MPIPGRGLPQDVPEEPPGADDETEHGEPTKADRLDVPQETADEAEDEDGEKGTTGDSILGFTSWTR